MSDTRPEASRNFWLECPRQLDYHPTTACPLGFASLQNAKTPPCAWWINSPTHHYCFWTWLRSYAKKDKKVKPLTLAETSKLLLLPNATIREIQVNALEKLQANPKLKDLL